MATATYLLLAIGLLGALDIALFHTWQHRLHHLPSARKELVLHALRGPTYAALFLLVPNFEFHGWAFAALMILLAFDAVISIVDFALEGESRAPVGGLPDGEYVLHMAIAMLFGAFVALVWVHGMPHFEQPAALVYHPHVADTSRALLAVMAVGVFASGIADAIAVVRLGRRST